MAQLINAMLTGSHNIVKGLGNGDPVVNFDRSTPFLNFLEGSGLVQSTNGADPFTFTIQTAGTTAATFVEADAISSYGSPTFYQASVTPWYLRSTPGNSGRVRDGNRGNYTFDVLKGMLESAKTDVRKQIEVELLGSTANRGISSIVDAGDSYAGLDPASVTAWAALETAVGGALTVAVMEDMHETMRGNTYSATPDFILAAPNQVTNYIRTIGPGASSGGVFRMNMGDGRPFDIGVLGRGVMFNNIPFVETPELTTTELVMGDSKHIKLAVHRDYDVRNIAATNDDDKWQVSWAGCLVVNRRKSFGRLTGVTA